MYVHIYIYKLMDLFVYYFIYMLIYLHVHICGTQKTIKLMDTLRHEPEKIAFCFCGQYSTQTKISFLVQYGVLVSFLAKMLH